MNYLINYQKITIFLPDLGAEKQITGGGTYNLTALFDSEKVESTGFAFGFDRIMEAYHRQNIQVPISSKPKVLVIPVKKEFKFYRSSTTITSP